MKKIIASLLVLCSMSAWADGRWVSDYIQGTSTYTQSIPGTQAYLAIECPSAEDRGPMVFFSPDGESTPQQFSVTLDKTPYQINDHVLPNQKAFDVFYNSLREAKQVTVTFEGKQYDLNNDNAEEVIPPDDSPEFACGGPQAAADAAVALNAPAPTASDFEVEFFDQRSNRGLQELPRNSLHLTSKMDNVTIVAVIANRGKCAINPGAWKRNDKFPTQLGFSDTAVYELAPTASCNNLLEFSVITNRGTVVYAKQ